ncbi:hypothetical protein Pcinc_003141 [Petrolisthes cinctipes]|uniref:Uncharacterized protein n=1 Tax=Petrolisthes cinctipes TaxID=88211 RepID=A0AAE1GI66_PETCI|nr:hypothetical protein Pcinc_003141 [Petrolisthes cinctipes]
MSWCVTVVVVSDDLTFLTTFAEWSLKSRLLVWSTRLLVITRLPREDLVLILSSRWTFSMTNAMMLNVDQSSPSLRRPERVVEPANQEQREVRSGGTAARKSVNISPPTCTLHHYISCTAFDIVN